MQLVADVGNTETVLGLAPTPDTLAGHWRISTGVPRTVDETVVLLRALLRESGVDPAGIWRAVVGSVVPGFTPVLSEAFRRILEGPVMTVGPGSPLPIKLDVDEPMTVGADRIVNTLAARELYHRDTVAVDLGTATTFDCISADGVFHGGVISPGLPAGLEWLGRRTAKLPRVELEPPSSVIGRRTETCIQSGVFFSAVDAVDGVVERIRREWGRPDAYVVATGGFAEVLGPHLRTVDRIEPFLTLYGLALAGEHMAHPPA